LFLCCPFIAPSLFSPIRRIFVVPSVAPSMSLRRPLPSLRCPVFEPSLSLRCSVLVPPVTIRCQPPSSLCLSAVSLRRPFDVSSLCRRRPVVVPPLFLQCPFVVPSLHLQCIFIATSACSP
jgi:hypothetical protein